MPLPETTELAAPFSGAAWALSGLLFDLERVLDDEGRPLNETRAANPVKKGVEFDLRACPYHDLRRGKLMNVSALSQVTRHMEAALEDIAGFRALAGERVGSWNELLVGVVDQLAGPALHALACGDPGAPVPAPKAVGYKLAAGFFGALEGLLSAEARGEPHEVSVSGLLGYVEEQGLLVGASEACAGPPGMIEHVSGVFVDGLPGCRPAVAGRRLPVARELVAQIGLGRAWGLFDRAAERELLIGQQGATRLRPRTRTLERALGERHHELSPDDESGLWEHARRAIPAAIPGPERSRLGRAMIACRALETGESHLGAFEELISFGDGALEITDTGFRDRFARFASGYVSVYRLVVAHHYRSELLLRGLLGSAPERPVKLSRLILPAPRTLRWIEAALGHRLRCAPAAAPTVAFRNHRRERAFLFGSSSALPDPSARAR